MITLSPDCQLAGVATLWLAVNCNETITRRAIAFAANHPGVTSPIIGPRTMEQLENQLPAADVVLATDAQFLKGTRRSPRCPPAGGRALPGRAVAMTRVGVLVSRRLEPVRPLTYRRHFSAMAFDRIGKGPWRFSPGDAPAEVGKK